jgi:hypothetical protein
VAVTLVSVYFRKLHSKLIVPSALKADKGRGTAPGIAKPSSFLSLTQAPRSQCTEISYYIFDVQQDIAMSSSSPGVCHHGDREAAM